MNPIVTIFASKYTPAWPRRTDGQAWHVDIATALVEPFETDAHFAPYVSDIPHRISKGSAAAANARMTAIVFDVDAPGKRVTPEWREGERRKIAALREARPGGSAYTTMGGYRLVYGSKPFALANVENAWRDLYLSRAAWLKFAFGIAADMTCCDWTRLFRLPRVVRDGVRQVPETIGDPAAIGVWTDVKTPPEPKKAATIASETAAEMEARLAGRVPRDWRVQCAREWFALQAPAIQGERGDELTWAVLLRATHNFCLTDPEMIRAAFAEWNARCVPPWEGRELDHKIADALNSKHVRWNHAIDLQYAVEGRR